MAYRKAWLDFQAFATSFQLPNTLPLSAETTALFATHLHKQGKHSSTVRTALAGIAFMHHRGGHPDPTKSF